MAALCWMAVTLSVLLYAGSCSAIAMTLDQLTYIVDEVWYGITGFGDASQQNWGGRYKRHPLFSVAVSIPYDEEKKTYDISQVFKTDPVDTVKETILNYEKYRGKRMVAATVLKWPNVCPDEPVQWEDVLKECNSGKPMTWAQLDEKLTVIYSIDEIKRDFAQQRCYCGVWDGRSNHAEYRTLEVFNTLVNQENKNDFLLFYVEYSPCTSKCASKTHPQSILPMLADFTKWKNRAFVFSYVFENPKERNTNVIPETLAERRGALERLGEIVGKTNIFRCDGVNLCISCFTNDVVEANCISNK